MEVALPDIIGEYLDTPQRFEISGIQLAGYFEPARIAPEAITNLYVFLQNTVKSPIKVNVKAIMPQKRGFLSSGRPLLHVHQPNFELDMQEAEAGLLILPVTTTEHVKPGQHAVTIELKTTIPENAKRVRPAQAKSQLTGDLIDNPVGLNLVGSLGSNYTSKTVKHVSFQLEVAGQPSPPERAPRLNHQYNTVWVMDQLEFFNRAIHELNLRQVKLQSELTIESLYVNLYAESTSRFADAGVPLRIGEAIILAKILTYSCQYFLSKPNLRNGLLVPIWERAFEADRDTTDGLHVIRTVGYHHILKLAIAISFGILGKALGQHYWPLVERQAVASYIADSIEDGQELEEDFLYLPLLIAGTQVFDKFKLHGENVNDTLALMKAASEARPDLLAAEEMAQARKIFQLVLKRSSQKT